ncbi:MAG: GNAT family N-acetyltransferase [Sulfuricella sp.]|nr:GNAT family N-acetyltransferase [Sulfuricella sp.]
MNREPNYGALYGGTPPLGIPPEPLIINVCLTGNVPTRQTSPHVPLTVSEIVEDAIEVLEAGASMLHIHARDADGIPTWQPEVFGRIFGDIRRHRPDAILVATTGGRQHGTLEKRAAVLELGGQEKPDMASLTLGSLNFPTQASVNAPEMVQALCTRMRERGVTPELEAFDMGMVNYGYYLQRKGFLPHTCYINLLLGNLGTLPGRVQDMAALARELPRHWIWAGAGIGRHQLAMNSAALLMGGHVRVGLEDNAYYDYGDLKAATNRALVERITRLAGEFGRPIATCGEVRNRLRLDDPENWLATQTVIRKMRAEDMPAAMAVLGRWNMAPLQASERIPHPERDHLELANTFVAILQGKIVGVASWLQIDSTRAETASLAVDPEFIGCGVGHKLQEARLAEMRDKGIREVRTEADRPDVIRWYVDKFGYRIIGTNPKKHSFGLAGCGHWTVLELRL